MGIHSFLLRGLDLSNYRYFSSPEDLILLVLVGSDPEDDLAGIYHVELCTCNALDVCVILAHFLLRSDLPELIRKKNGLGVERLVLCLETGLLLDDV